MRTVEGMQNMVECTFYIPYISVHVLDFEQRYFGENVKPVLKDNHSL
jgi:hypothetical protein